MLVPWDDEKDGPFLGYYGRYAKTEDWSWRENFEFVAILKIEWISWTYDSCVHLLDETAGTEYNMFLTDFEKMLLSGTSVYDCHIAGRWTWIKRGTKFGLRSVDAPK
jgi:hypothetical protein